MERGPIPIEKLITRPYGLFEVQWLLLTSGDFNSNKYNTMTISWGSLGVMWGRPIAMVVVRPQRYTRQFIDQYPTFTLCAFPAQYHEALDLLGTISGRDGDKIAQAGLTPQASSCVAAPSFAEAELAIECAKIYWHDFDPAHFIDPKIDRNYKAKDYHRMYFGEILAVRGATSYQG